MQAHRSLASVVAVVVVTAAAPALAIKVGAVGGAGGIGGIPDHGTLDPGPGWAPGTFGPPPAPAFSTIGVGGVTEVGMTWRNSAAAEMTRVQRRINGGPWVTVASYGFLAEGTFTSFTDTSAQPDAENCYVIQAGNSYGWAGSDFRCNFTRDGREIDVHRVQLFVRIANVADAGSDDPVEVRLQSPAWLENWRPAGNASWVDTTANDDFDRGVSRRYELLTTNLSDLSDITMITIDKKGDDDMCVAEVELVINDQAPSAVTVFHRVFGETSATCRKVTTGQPLGVTFAELRAAPQWQAAQPASSPLGISNSWLLAQIQASFADELHGTGARLGGGSIHSELVDDDSLRFYVPLFADASIFGTTQTNVRFDLDLVSTCADGVIHTELTASNVDADSVFDTLPLVDLVQSVVLAPVLYYVSSEIEDAVDVATDIDVSTPTCDLVLGYDAQGSIVPVFAN